MPTIDFKRGFSCGLVAAGISFGGSGGGGLPDGTTLNIINCDLFRGDWGHGVAYLNADTFSTVFSSDVYYAPTSGIVIIGSFELMDWDDRSGARAEAILEIVADDQVIYEGDIYDYFQVDYAQELERMKAFSYKSSFSILAKRTNLTDAMALELYKTCIVETI